MSTVSKAVDLLNWFSAERASISLAEFQRLTGRDKATTYRYLSALESTGLVERDRSSRAYRMGPTVLRLAHVRELTVPRRAGVQPVLRSLAERTGELAHVSILQADTLVALIDHASTRHSARVVLEEPLLPLHATASGMAVMAFGDATLLKATRTRLKRFTDATPATQRELEAALKLVRESGFGMADQTYEAGVFGTAVPLYDSTHSVAGAVAVASVAGRINADTIHQIQHGLTDAARAISRSWGGTVPDELEQRWASTLSVSPSLTTAC